MPNTKTDGFGFGIPMLLDTATCTKVSDPHAFEFGLAFAPTGIAGIDAGLDKIENAATDFDLTRGVQLAPIAAGSTTLHVTARQRSTGKVVAATDIPVTVG